MKKHIRRSITDTAAENNISYSRVGIEAFLNPTEDDVATDALGFATVAVQISDGSEDVQMDEGELTEEEVFFSVHEQLISWPLRP